MDAIINLVCKIIEFQQSLYLIDVSLYHSRVYLLRRWQLDEFPPSQVPRYIEAIIGEHVQDCFSFSI